MKKWVVVIAIGLLMAACQGDATAPEVDGGAAADPISLQVFGEPEETRVYRSLIEQYEKDNPDAEVELIEIAEREDHLARLSTSFAGGDPPDLFLINYREYSQFIPRGAIQPIEDLVTERGIDLDDYYEPPRQAFTFDGQLQCMPQNISSLAVYFNTRLFKRAGIEPAHDGWTWEEFRDAGRALTASGVEGIGIDPEIIRVAPFVWSNGGELTDDPVRPTRFTLDEPASREALEFIVSLVREEGVVPTEQEIAAQDAETRFINGTLGMLLSSRRDTPVFREVTSLRWDVLPLPQAGQPAGILHSDAYCISAGSDARESAADFVSFAMSPDGQTLSALSGRTVPSLIEVSKSGAFLDPSQPPAHSEVFLDAIEGMRYTPVLPTWPEIEDVAEEVLTKAFYEEGYTIDDAIEELDQKTRPLFEEAAAE